MAFFANKVCCLENALSDGTVVRNVVKNGVFKRTKHATMKIALSGGHVVKNGVFMRTKCKLRLELTCVCLCSPCAFVCACIALPMR